ncbi:MAG: DUF1893 domain-containing protein [Ruminococcus sp.]|nr:DUF1893 domain-containing protein [Ruminococcus sp.]
MTDFMTDLQKAKELLENGSFTCVLCRDGQTFKSTKAGISPMLDYIAEGIDLSGFSAADKIVGKAAAMLFALAGVKALHAQTLSRSAEEILRMHRIQYTYDIRTEGIINRRGDGLCPMEQAVASIENTDLQGAYKALCEKQAELRKGVHGL